MNFAKLVTEAQRLAGRVDSSFNERTKNWINEALQRWATKDPWGTLREELDITSEGTRNLYLPAYVGKINYVFDKTNCVPVIRKENWDRNAPTPYGQQTSGKPYYWREMGFSPVASYPPSSPDLSIPQEQSDGGWQLLFYQSSDPVVTFYVEGLTSTSGVTSPGMLLTRHSEYVTCNSGVAAGTQSGVQGMGGGWSGQYVKVLSLGRVDAASGQALVKWYYYDQYYGDVYWPAAVIESTEYQPRYRNIQLLYVPTQGTEFTINYTRRIDRLEGDNQFPPPSVNPHFLIWWAAGNIHSAMKEMDNAREKWSMAEKFLAEDAHHEEAHGDQDTSSIPDVALWGVDQEEGWTP